MRKGLGKGGSGAMISKTFNRIINFLIILALIAVGWFAFQLNFLNCYQIYLNSQRPKIVQNVQISDDQVQQIEADCQKQKIGTISIPSLGILLPIDNQPYNHQALMTGAQQMKANQSTKEILGLGNYIVVGHNLADGRSYFSPLQQNTNCNFPYLIHGHPQDNHWLNGKNIYVARQDHIYDFKITNQKAVLDTDMNILNDTHSPQITLITCLEPDDHYRIVTTGQLVKQWKWNDAPLKVVGLFDLKHQKYNLIKE